MSSITAEEFQLYQQQLLALRDEKYELEAQLKKANLQINQLKKQEPSNDLKSNIFNKLQQLSQPNPQIDCSRENVELKHKLSQIEAQFQTQTSTLIAECHRLTTDNEELRKRVQADHEITAPEHRQTQTPRINQRSQSTQSDLSAQQLDQFEAASADFESEKKCSSELKERVCALEAELLQQQALATDQKSRLNKTLTECQVRSAEQDTMMENLRAEIVLIRRNNEKIVKDLKRQLAASVKRQLNSRGSQSSLTSCNSRAESTGTAPPLVNGHISNSPSLSNGVDTSEGTFSETDLKDLLDKLTTVQDENCSLKHHITKLREQLASKSAIIQRYMSLTSVNSNSHGTIKATKTDNPKTMTNVAQVLSGVLLRGTPGTSSNLSSSVQKSATGGPNEILFLKDLCEELMTKNMCLEQSLETATLELQKLSEETNKK